MDALSQLVRDLRLRTRLFHRSTHCGRWVIDGTYESKAMFHLLAAGQCLLVGADGTVEKHLSAGDTVLFTRPAEHRLVSIPGSGSTEPTLLLCGYFEFDSSLAALLLASMPAQILLRRHPYLPGSIASDVSGLLNLIIAEAEQGAVGSDALIDKLADALFVYALRQCLLDENIHSGLLATLVDAHLGSALLAMHRDPAGAWTVAALAKKAHLSRAAFARHFRNAVGMAPITYLTRLRLQTARNALLERRISIAQAADLAGYATGAAFSHAYQRLFGFSLGSGR